jgi:hypothetical protein
MEFFPCRTRWHVKTREVPQLERRNETTRQMVIKATGKDSYELKTN